MSRVCPVTGKKTIFGNSLSRRGKAKYLGGVGRKTTGISRRRFRANMQRVRALVDGKITRVWVSAKAMRMGFIVKPPKRDRPQEQQAAAS
ncbi:MAG: 50S ribosomal protein L28 [Phycisphaerae bacterium]